MALVSINLVRQADDIRRFRGKRDSDSAFFEQHKYAERIHEYLVEHHHVTLSKDAKANLTEVIADRVSGVSGEDDFHERLERSVGNGGLKLDSKVSDGVTRYMEKLIALGVDVSYKS
jgi:hypothetical protein